MQTTQLAQTCTSMANLHYRIICDYCDAPLGVSSFLFSVQNVWEMTTVVDEIACCLYTACPSSYCFEIIYCGYYKLCYSIYPIP